MSNSQVNPNSINGNFPVAGQDNSSQGFRDNFTNIKNNFTYASQEITDLRNKAVLKSALTGEVLDNDLLGAQLTNAQLKSYTTYYRDLGDLYGPVTVDFNDGNFQKIKMSNSIVMSFANWPATSGTGLVGYAGMRIWFVVQDNAHTITLPSSVTIGTNDIAGFNADTNTLTFDVPGNYVFDFSSADGGTNFLIFDSTRNRVRFRDPSFYFNPDVSPTLLIGFGDVLPLAISLAQGNDTMTIRDSMSSYAGILERTTDPVPTYSNGDGDRHVAGYSVATSRSYNDPLTGLPVTDQTAIVQPGDYIGYVNFIGATVDPVTFSNIAVCDFGTIRGFVTGTSPYSPGGNLWFGTKKDTITSGGYLTPAMSLENDQSAHFYGDAITYGAEVSAGYQFANLSESSTVTVSSSTPIVLLDSHLSGTIASATIMLPPVATTKDGQKLTIASACDVTSVQITGDTTTAFVAESTITTPLGPATVLTVAANPHLQPGLVVFGVPSYVSGQAVVSVLDNGPFTANLIITASADVPATYGDTLTFTSGIAGVKSAPSSYTADQSDTWIFRSANLTWYKI